MSDDFSDDQKAKIYQYLYRHTTLTRDQVWSALQSKGYREAYAKIASKFRIEESIEDIV
jgi:hypothetical protein